MQALNHVVFGSLIALTVNEPAVAVPLAFGSHFILDTIPHYGDDPKAPTYSRPFFVRLLIDIILSILIVLLFISLNPPNKNLIIICAIAAVTPDILWPIALKVKQRGLAWEFFKFHKRIQTETPKGIRTELIWFLITATLVVLVIKI